MNGILGSYRKGIAWFFALLLYAELTISPLIANASPQADYRLATTSNRSDWKKYFNEKYRKSIRDYFAAQHSNTNLSESEQVVVAKNGPHQIDGITTTGPTQPEMQSFSSVNNANMVDLFTGDFSYNIPLIDVGGYPVNLAYRSGISMDQEASWCGLGWNINPGTITRNMRGLPDDFNGRNDSIKKTLSIKENVTVGVNAGADMEIVGLPFSFGASFGIFNNNYKGWGLEYALNSSINAGLGSTGILSGGLSITNNTQEGVTVAPTLSMKLESYDEKNNSGVQGSFGIGLTYNSRSGLKALQVSAGIRQYSSDSKNQLSLPNGSGISFVSPGYTPSITIPFTSHQFSFTGKIGGEISFFHPTASISGYVSKQRIDKKDTLLALPSYGYLHFQDGAQNRSSLLDFNREKELPYREKPGVPHIAIPSYTYDAFSITGEGTGGMFRAYRGDIGFIHDHFIRTKDASDRASVDIGTVPNLAHAGVDINITRAFTQNGPWLNQNSLKNVIDFRKSDSSFEAVYFRNPGEKSLNSKKFYEAIGGDDVVTVDLFQPGSGSSLIQATNYLTRHQNKRAVGRKLLTPQTAAKDTRDKRAQVISYLTAKEADVAGLSKYIENHTVNAFNLANCNNGGTDVFDGKGTGLYAEYFDKKNLRSIPKTKSDSIYYDWGKGRPRATPSNVPFFSPFPEDQFSIRWSGRIKAPVTGQYIFRSYSDDGIRIWLNDSLLRNHNKWTDHGHAEYKDTVYLLGGEMYKIKVEYYENTGKSEIKLEWKYPPLTNWVPVPKAALYPPALDTFRVNNHLIKEKRVNNFRKENHISQINVVNNDGRRYVYGIPVYNLKQKETTFSANGKDNGNANSGMVKYSGTDNTAQNSQGRDEYYSSEEIPAYAHSFLLTGILSADYVDVTDNGVSDDDIGDAVKFNYSKIRGVKNPFRWRAPVAKDSATFNEGLKTDSRDDKGSYVYGEKELWYLHSIESKTMVATFELEARADLAAVSENGSKSDGETKRIKEIKLYSKADLLKHGAGARPIKTVHFEYSYELCRPANDSGKLTLKKVWFTYNGNEKGKQNPYIFHYNQKNPGYNAKSYDRWGNYKDPLDNPGSTAGNIITNAEYTYALQDSAKAAVNAGAWALDSIALPSGGTMKITYESDDYGFVQHKRAMQLFKIVGLGTSSTMPSIPSDRLYTAAGDHLYVYVSIPSAVSTTKQVYQKYLQDVHKLYFRLFVRMPSDIHGNGSEYVSCYADLDQGNSYGVVNANTIWLKVSGISLKGDGGGSYSPLAKAAIQFLRLNLPSKAYPGSEIGDDIDPANAVKLLVSLADNIKTSVTSFDNNARDRGWATKVDTSRSFVRLNSPSYKKYGGGHRVKRITIYDNWDRMTGRRPATYGQDYIYTTSRAIDGTTTQISSGVASYEPSIGSEENPFREPIEYNEKIAPLAPVTLGYSEAPLGESFFPAASVGYSKVRVRSINYKNVRSANGFEETEFYTAYDFPTHVDRSVIDSSTKKRFKPGIANFLRINAKHYLTLSQGFKIELNDMHGKIKSQASYPQTDSKNYITYTEYVYRTENPSMDQKQLSNTVMVMMPDGTIDSAGMIGKDVELMVDMREQQSITNGYNVNLNTDMFVTSPLPPFWLIPSLLNLAQREENLYRSVATTKIIQRYGILDSVIHVDKGSKVSTKDILYDSETGNVLLTRTQNEFNDPVYNFNYPSHWAYDGMGLAYRNIGVVLNGITIRDGRITDGSVNANSSFFSSGDEILVAGRQKAGPEVNCQVDTTTFASYTRIWAIDTSLLAGGQRTIYFIDREGKPYNGFGVSLKIIRSGRRNIHTSVGSVTSRENPLVKDSIHRLILNTNSKVLQASAGEFRQTWNVEDIKKQRITRSCIELPFAACDTVSTTQCTNECVRKLFDYLIASKRLFIKKTDNILLSQLVQDANTANPLLDLDVQDCPLFGNNSNKPFYALTTDSLSNYYRAMIGNCTIGFNSIDGRQVPFYSLSFTSYVNNRPNYQYSSSLTNNSFQRFFGGANEDLTHHTIQTNDNGSLVVGQTNSFGATNVDGYVIKLDSNGAVQWSKTYGGSGEDIIVKAKKTSDGGYILGGNTKSFGFSRIAAWLTKIDASGNVTWSRRYISDTAHGDKLFDVIQTSDGSYAFAGGHKYTAGIVNIMVVKTDASGNVGWAKSFNSGEGEEGYGIEEHSDSLLVAGFYDDGIDLNSVLMKMSKVNGNLAWTKAWDFDKRSNRLGSIYPVSDGYVISGVNASGYQTMLARHNVVKTDFNGNLIFVHELFTTPLTMNGYTHSTPNGGYLAQTIETLTDTSADIYITKVEADGNVTWSQRFSTDGQQLHGGVLQSANGIITALASAQNGVGNRDIQLMRTDTSGTIQGCNTSLVPAFVRIPQVSPISGFKWKDTTDITFNSSQTVTPNVSTVTTNTDTICQSIPPDAIIAYLEAESCQSCDTIIDNTCRSVVVDTAFNPYVAGVLGNWRANKSYTYFGRRAESDPTTATNIRENGTFQDFVSYWHFSNNVLSTQPDTTRWVWNSEITRYNRKGFEIENRDPLGRYNSGLYGYNLTMPVAVTQNSRFRESAYEGFEDYGFATQVCDTACAATRHLDFSAFKNKLDTSQRHSGKSSLKLTSMQQASVTVNVSTVTTDTLPAKLTTTTQTNCSNTVLQKIVAPSSVLLPSFSPLQEKRMLLSAWVREDQDCRCMSYANNTIVVAFAGGSSSSIDFNPSGNIIEGWQRYEAVFDVPADATSMTVSLQSTGAPNVYFDDLRIHPFNANMKSFVYNPIDLRLMAELDENNYTAFYEYDDDGTLIRVKKETQRGIKTIKETRSALLKQ